MWYDALGGGYLYWIILYRQTLFSGVGIFASYPIVTVNKIRQTAHIIKST